VGNRLRWVTAAGRRGSCPADDASQLRSAPYLSPYLHSAIVVKDHDTEPLSPRLCTQSWPLTTYCGINEMHGTSRRLVPYVSHDWLVMISSSRSHRRTRRDGPWTVERGDGKHLSRTGLVRLPPSAETRRTCRAPAADLLRYQGPRAGQTRSRHRRREHRGSHPPHA